MVLELMYNHFSSPWPTLSSLETEKSILRIFAVHIGRRQVNLQCRSLRSYHFDHLASSPLQRLQATAGEAKTYYACKHEAAYLLLVLLFSLFLPIFLFLFHRLLPSSSFSGFVILCHVCLKLLPPPFLLFLHLSAETRLR
jgi:hypothetical protein